MIVPDARARDLHQLAGDRARGSRRRPRRPGSPCRSRTRRHASARAAAQAATAAAATSRAPPAGHGLSFGSQLPSAVPPGGPRVRPVGRGLLGRARAARVQARSAVRRGCRCRACRSAPARLVGPPSKSHARSGRWRRRSAEVEPPKPLKKPATRSGAYGRRPGQHRQRLPERRGGATRSRGSPARPARAAAPARARLGAAARAPGEQRLARPRGSAGPPEQVGQRPSAGRESRTSGSSAGSVRVRTRRSVCSVIAASRAPGRASPPAPRAPRPPSSARRRWRRRPCPARRGDVPARPPPRRYGSATSAARPRRASARETSSVTWLTAGLSFSRPALVCLAARGVSAVAASRTIAWMSLRALGLAPSSTSSRSTTPRVWSGPSTPPSGIAAVVGGPGDEVDEPVGHAGQAHRPDRGARADMQGIDAVVVQGHLHIGQPVVGQVDRGDLTHLAPADLDQVAAHQLARRPGTARLTVYALRPTAEQHRGHRDAGCDQHGDRGDAAVAGAAHPPIGPRGSSPRTAGSRAVRSCGCR